MSTFAVEIRMIEKIWKHPNADKLSLAKVEGLDYQFVVALDQYKPGDPCVYFPVDSILPDELIKKIGLEGKLAGKAKNRVKTIKLRKEISQGVCSSVNTVFGDAAQTFTFGSDVTATLGVTKYDPDLAVSGGPNRKRVGSTKPRHSKVSYYDIESMQRYSKIAENYADQFVIVTEKLEGMNVALLLEKNGTMTICSRNCTTETIPGTSWGRFVQRFHGFVGKLLGRKVPPLSQHYIAVANSGWFEKIRKIAAQTWPEGAEFILRGEVVGPDSCGNIYKLKELKAVAFDLEIVLPNKKYYLDAENFHDLCDSLSIETCPILVEGLTLREYLGDQTIAQLSTGPSKYLPSQLREGIVIKFATEIQGDHFGRVYFKMRSPEYLAENDN